ncbi:MAG: hypothetical protein EOP86_03900 [Verrucomicrobiaceae bacterium]|nr:MAG: hypothetical protein EOP86_03900 [Verrucomicrobiaceae bacterium]
MRFFPLCASLLCLFPLLLKGAPDQTPFPQLPDIKGLQVQMVDDALALGVHHAGINVNISSLMDPEKREGNPRWTCEGTEYAFQARVLAALDKQVKPLSEAGVAVYLIILAYPTGDPVKDKTVQHSSARADRSYSIGAFNTATDEGRRWLRAVMEFLADRWSGAHPEHGRVWGWIIGNEVNSHWLWYNLGKMPMAEAAAEYEKAFRIAHQSVRKASANARLYIPLDHHWKASMPGISPEEATSGRDFMDTFARLAREGEGGDYDWALAHHPYPDDLGNPRTWLDKDATPDDDSPHVTFKNLEVLSKHLSRPELLWRGKPRRVILSEQGFHTLDRPEGEDLQAAAFAYAWEKCRRVPLVDAFIYHRHVDHSQEGGLMLGLWRHKAGSISTPDRSKRIYPLFKAAGTPGWSEAASFALPLTGLKSWDELPGS